MTVSDLQTLTHFNTRNILEYAKVPLPLLKLVMFWPVSSHRLWSAMVLGWENGKVLEKLGRVEKV